jgi:hypothetical protein
LTFCVTFFIFATYLKETISFNLKKEIINSKIMVNIVNILEDITVGAVEALLWLAAADDMERLPCRVYKDINLV